MAKTWVGSEWVGNTDIKGLELNGSKCCKIETYIEQSSIDLLIWKLLND